MPKKAGILLLLLGAVLMVSALLLFLKNEETAQEAGQEAERLLAEVQAVISRNTTTQPQTEPTESEPLTEPEASGVPPSLPPTEAPTEPHTPKELQEVLSPEMPVAEVGGYECVGILTLPEEALELPVMADWDYYRLNVAPCRQFGSSRTDDLVIAAHNYSTHFQCLKDMEPGAPVTFTDMEGIVNHYVLTELRTLSPEDVDAVQNSGYPLVLYTCTYGGANRIVAFFSRSEMSANSMGGDV